MTENETPDVVVIPTTDPRYRLPDMPVTEWDAPVVDETGRLRDEILTAAEDMFRQARDLTVEGLKRFGLLEKPQHPNLPIHLGQQIEQVIEHRRLKR